ncbi:TetR family transcriptional regulator [Stackebrandtia albiflava]|uniref:TetR family transcriptional regulator n=1 Tax=Stackebrandtia albiflava TaxID=406432 RepID=A0A562V5B8_9ACTN|nr:TetR/AcrR family transcriptional regulator [Stackebrandtia albiflava]TWJ13022.1 TetR family transcriptional regulator [Stackebrandtia albiflava]
MREPGNTRERIQQVAMDLFTEQGYEQTSLREIAERLGVTKAALYYHFKTKEEIAASFFEGFGADVDALVAWSEERTPNLEARRELVNRYADLLMRHHTLLRFMHQNPPVLRKQDKESIFKQRMHRLHGFLVDPDAPLIERLRAHDAIMTMHSAWFLPIGLDADHDELRDATVRISVELLERNAEGGRPPA